MQERAQQRQPGVDLVRVVGLVAVVLAHAVVDPAVARATYSWHVPLFFVLAGYFWRPGRPLSNEVKRRTQRLLVPYLFWLVVLVGLRLAADPAAWADVLVDAGLGGSYATRPLTAFWFVTALFVATVLYRLLERLPPPLRVAAVAAGLLANVLFGRALAEVPLSAGTALGTLVFLALGQALQPRLRQVGVLPAVGLLVVAGALVATGVSAPLDLKNGSWGTPVLSVLVACMLCVSLLLLAGKAVQHLPSLGRVSVRLEPAFLVVVLVHPAVLFVLLVADEVREGVPGGLATVTTLAFLVPALLGLVLASTRVAWLTNGQARSTSVARFR